jgi:hypothetical protein
VIAPRQIWLRSEREDIEISVRAWTRGAFLVVGIGGACANCGRDLAETGSLRARRGTIAACGCGQIFELEVVA